MALTQNKKYTPSGLPFLQAQILKQIYLYISKNKSTDINLLSKISDYPPQSKILNNAIETLVNKNFIIGSFSEGFVVPEDRFDFFQQVIKNFDCNGKVYSSKIINHINNNSTQVDLFIETKSISDLNRFGVIHKWYDYLEDFPYSLIEDKFIEYKLKNDSIVVDPFCGSGTTMVTANMFHYDAIGFDANPLMTFVSKVKTTWDIHISKLNENIRKISDEFIKKVKTLKENSFQNGFLQTMPKKELNQWLSPRLQQEVSLLKSIISEINDKKIRDLLLMAMSKSCFDASYVSLCPGTTFYPFREKEEFWNLFTDKIIQIYYDLKAIQIHNHYGKTKTITDTCLNAQSYMKENSIDFIITSPPYPNDLEYTRQTRLELYLLDFVENMNDIQKIKRRMAKGSTKLIFKESNSEIFIEKFNSVKSISSKIYEQTKDKNWGFDYPRMVREYFGDMYLCMKEFFPLMKSDSCFLLVVGDQTIKGVFIPVCDILIELAKEIGYKNCRKETYRVRRSTAHNIPLPEDIVILER
ncbi:MAG: hypothetical protein H8D22_07255 [Candidatus Cloacimonetes bacterium]|nr:hypothetical protein [Candidatus Cloacimonadota bacterium]